MRATYLLVATGLLASLAACSSSKSSPSHSAGSEQKVMPNVTGKRLDLAETAVKQAGVNSDSIQIDGGGRFGVVLKSNWYVCSQMPAAGQVLPSKPELAIEHTCPASTSTQSASPTTSAPEAGSSSGGTLTLKNSSDLAALLKVTDNCSSTIKTFATKYAGRDIEFDGSVAEEMGHADRFDTRHDILIGAGNKGPNYDLGPNFQFQNVSNSDLHLTGANAPGSLSVGDKLDIVAEVVAYTGGNSCLFQLVPVSTSIR